MARYQQLHLSIIIYSQLAKRSNLSNSKLIKIRLESILRIDHIVIKEIEMKIYPPRITYKLSLMYLISPQF